ncbi:hypothetical protein F5Y15DRAFT_110183 [Xylariaceae sp. FL0016]|nr:hypothetical protein F5Y15DRAFT_110183 [Xylariaceae sp. FL0016]
MASGYNPRFGNDGNIRAPPPGGFHGNMMPPAGYRLPGAYGPNQGAHYPLAPHMRTPFGQGPAYTSNPVGYQHPVPFFPGAEPRFPRPHPRVSLDFPGMNMTNSTGGSGCEPGYNYIFHGEHTKIHVLQGKTPPWRAPGMSIPFAAFHVPCNTTIRELMAFFGAANPIQRMNKICEVVQGGNGTWHRGMIFSGDEKEDLKKIVKDIGWDISRCGRPGEKPVVWIWVTKG